MTTTSDQSAAPAVEQPQDAPETAQEPTEAPEDEQTVQEPQEDEQAPHDGEDGGKAAREARKYRQRLRAAEADLEAAHARIETLQRAEVERIAAVDHGIARPAAVWAGGLNLAEVRDADGNIDSQAAAARITQIRDDLGLAATRDLNRAPDPAQHSRPTEDEKDDWNDAFRF